MPLTSTAFFGQARMTTSLLMPNSRVFSVTTS